MGKVEIGHIHRNGMVDIPFTRSIRAVLVTEGLAETHHLLAQSGWISYYIRSDANVEGALWLYRLSWPHKQRGCARRDPARRAQIDAALRNMQLSEGLAKAVGV